MLGSGLLSHGVLAGAAGTTALEATTFLDMALRCRPASTTPEQTVEHLAQRLHVPFPHEQARREARVSGIATLLGIAAGVSTGVVLSALRSSPLPRGAAAHVATAWVLVMLAGNGPMTLLRVTDPRGWTRQDWLADVVPHLAYAVAASRTLSVLGR